MGTQHLAAGVAEMQERGQRRAGPAPTRASAHGALRAAVAAVGLPYVAGIRSSATVWPPDAGPSPPKAWTPGRGRAAKRLRRDCRAPAHSSLRHRAPSRVIGISLAARVPGRATAPEANGMFFARLRASACSSHPWSDPVRLFGGNSTGST
ncbi:MAG: transposase [Acetobacteraceae bacterium]|nr:transposase [Acetobacteraceae bacterium]